MAATTARPHSVAYSDRRRAASVDFHPSTGESSAKRSVSTSQARKSRTKSPEVVGQYILYSTLGQGSMGKVKLARHRKTGQLVGFSSLINVFDPTWAFLQPRSVQPKKLPFP
jgi:serine/threonine protein kinase